MYLLSKEQLENIKNWKYFAINESIIDEFLNPIYDIIINYTPIYISPNLITLTGFLCSLFIWFIVENFYTPILIPLIIMFYCIMSILDSLDGKQARKIKNSTPMGEMLDHSVDIVTLFIITRITSIIINIDEMNLVPVYIAVGIIFCHTHYQACISGYVKLNRYCGPNEVIFLIILMYLSSPFIQWKVIFGSSLFYYSCFMIPFILVLYFSCFFLPVSEFIVEKRMLINIPKVIYILAYINLFNMIYPVSYLTIVSIFIVINTELIITKISQSQFREFIIYLSILSLLNASIAFFVMLSYIIVTFAQIKFYLNIPFLSTF